MPANPEWFPRLPEIIERFERITVNRIEREIFENVFRVSRRQAIRLMHEFGGKTDRSVFIVGRETLLEKLHAMRDEFDIERERKARVMRELEEFRRMAPGRKVRIETASDVYSRTVAQLPAGIHLEPGKLVIEFSNRMDLYRQLFELAQAALNDEASLAARIEPASEGAQRHEAREFRISA